MHSTLVIKTLRIAKWNANGVLNHTSEIIQFLQVTNIDILLEAETQFTDRTVVKILNYSIYHCNHPDGGAAIIIRTTLQQ